jgi:hypothetical protein
MLEECPLARAWKKHCKVRFGGTLGTVYTVVCRQSVILGVQCTITVINSATRRLEFGKYRRMMKPPANLAFEEMDLIVRRSAKKYLCPNIR